MNDNKKALENLNKLVSQLTKQGIPKDLKNAELTIWFNRNGAGLYDNSNLEPNLDYEYNRELNKVEEHLCCGNCGTEGFVSEEYFDDFDYDKMMCKNCYSEED